MHVTLHPTSDNHPLIKPILPHFSKKIFGYFPWKIG